MHRRVRERPWWTSLRTEPLIQLTPSRQTTLRSKHNKTGEGKKKKKMMKCATRSKAFCFAHKEFPLLVSGCRAISPRPQTYHSRTSCSLFLARTRKLLRSQNTFPSLFFRRSFATDSGEAKGSCLSITVVAPPFSEKERICFGVC